MRESQRRNLRKISDRSDNFCVGQNEVLTRLFILPVRIVGINAPFEFSPKFLFIRKLKKYIKNKNEIGGPLVVLSQVEVVYQNIQFISTINYRAFNKAACPHSPTILPNHNFPPPSPKL